ncbi:MAG TPA: rhodanese-like domain-containing protein [Longimicrobiales bacterium]
MLLRLIYDDKLAQASYLLGCQACGEAIVIDPNRDADQYIRLARKEGVRITHVTETHIHADYLSGSRELAHRTGAKLVLSAHGGDDWSYRFPEMSSVQSVRDGDRFKVGNIQIEVMHTPGHTPEHICFLVTDTAAADKPIGLFSGDFVFVGDVGRPDLLEKAAGVANTMDASARALYKSLQRFNQLPDYMQVWPGHGAGSSCGKALGAVPQTTVGYEKMFNPALTTQSEQQFVDFILAGQPEPPKYFATMKRLNRDGPPLLNALPAPVKMDARELDGVMQAGTMIVDTRVALNFARGHVPGSINIPYNKSFTNWAGWLIPYDRDFALILDERTSAADVARDLALIGLDNVQGYFGEDAVKSWADPERTVSIRTAEMVELANRDDAVVIDVRNTNERQAGHVPGTIHIPLGELADRAGELPRDKPIAVHCQGGGRAAIGASVLQSLGFEQVLHVRGGYTEWQHQSAAPQVSDGD